MEEAEQTRNSKTNGDREERKRKLWGSDHRSGAGLYKRPRVCASLWVGPSGSKRGTRGGGAVSARLWAHHGRRGMRIGLTVSSTGRGGARSAVVGTCMTCGPRATGGARRAVGFWNFRWVANVGCSKKSMTARPGPHSSGERGAWGRVTCLLGEEERKKK